MRVPVNPLLLAAIALTGAFGAAAAQQSDSVPAPSCDGLTISAVRINPERPAFSGTARKWQLAARAVGLHHATTRSRVIEPYLLVHEGGICSDQRLAESERVLRSLPFLAGAKVVALPDRVGGVAVEVETTDEIPVLISGGVRHGRPSALSLGNENVAGEGLRLLAGIADNSPYQTGGLIQAEDYSPFGAPAVVRFGAARDFLGQHVELDASHLFLSNFQRGAWQASFRDGDDFPVIARPEGDRQAVQVRETRWSAGGVFRASVAGNTALWGPVVIGNNIRPTTRAFILSDSGAIADDDTALVSRFSAFRGTHIGGLFGLRRVRFVPRTGLDRLFATQDVMVGWQLGPPVAPGVPRANGRDVLFAQSAYLGGATGHTAFIADLEGEARRDITASAWASTAMNLYAAGYVSPTPRLLFRVQDNFSLLENSNVPTQLWLADRVGGARGFIGSRVTGGRRNVVRAEARFAREDWVRHADLGVALFADAANLWAGDVPYGAAMSARSVGFSILGAYPTKSKRVYRLDFAFPMNGRGGLQVRFWNGDPAGALTVEPNDVTRARLAPVPSSLFAWPGR
jgi:hypothetical protein